MQGNEAKLQALTKTRQHNKTQIVVIFPKNEIGGLELIITMYIFVIPYMSRFSFGMRLRKL